MKFSCGYADICIVVCLVILCGGCGTKSNTPVSRNWHAFTTRYNVYFNGSEHYKEQLKLMEDSYEDDFSRNLLIHPAEARANSRLTQPTGDFKLTIEKMQKAIQLHSITRKPRKRSVNAEEKAFREREEFNPFLHNAWLMMGKARYLDGDFMGAATTFRYITKHFKWLPEVVTEARLRQALCYCALDLDYEAENVLHLVKEKDLSNKRLRHLHNLAMADYLLRTGQYDAASVFICRAAESSSGMQRHRLWFLAGQVFSNIGEKHKAYGAFKQAGGGMSTPYLMKFNARIKQSEVFAGADIGKEISSLRSMTRYERNGEFLDQIYYAIGNLYLSRGDTASAAKNYMIAVEKSTRGGIDQALARLALGKIYFSRHEYVEAQPCYAGAIPLLPDDYPGYKDLRRRSDVLDELALYAGNVSLQDSLLRLSAMPRTQQEEVCRKIVDELIRRQKEVKDSIEREESLAGRETTDNPVDPLPVAATPISMNTDKSWYFYNSMTRNAGKSEFQRRWGARKLEDDWRRRNKNTFSLETEPTDDDVQSEMLTEETDSVEYIDSKVPDDVNDPMNVEYYLSRIPSTSAEIKNAHDIILESLYNMGLILKDRLEDYPAARREFMRLDTRYPDNIYRLDVYYNMYLMAVREDNEPLAEIWRGRILSDFPDSPYGKAMADPHYFSNLRHMHEVQEELYSDAYAAYLDNDNSVVHALTKKMELDYPLSSILPKFVFIDALSYQTEGNSTLFKDRLTELLERWPDTDMTDMASGIIRRMEKGMKPHAGISNARGLIWETRLSGNDSIAADIAKFPEFSTDPGTPHYLVLAFPRDSVNANQMLYEVAKFNFSSFVVKDFDLEQMSFSDIGLLVVKGFGNLREAERYRTVMSRSDISLPREVRPIIISMENFSILLSEGRSFEDYFRFQEQDVIPETQ